MSNASPVFQPVRSVEPVVDAVPDEPIMVIKAEPLSLEEFEAKTARLKRKPKDVWKDLPVCGTITVDNPTWAPPKATSVPPSLTETLGMQLSATFAILFNQSAHARGKRRWAVVTSRGTVVILAGVKPEQRPANPADFPPCVTAGLTHREAEDFTREANEPRFALAHIPRQWTISLRRADCVDKPESEVEGGAT